MGVQIRITSGPAIEKPGDLAALLTNLQEGDVLFIDEIQDVYKRQAFTLSEKEAAEGVILDDEAVMERLRSMENIRKMSWTKVLRCVMTASAMSRPILEQVGAIGPLRAQQVVVPVLAVGLCYEVESDVLRMLVYYICLLYTSRCV